MKKRIKINLGSGDDYKDGWINVDVDKNVKKDVEADLLSSFPFSDNYADELLANDILEHFTKEDGEKFLKECYRVLKRNGILKIRTHNIYQIFKQFNKDPQVLIHFLYGDTAEAGVFGSHKFAYTPKTIKTTLKRIGFEVASVERESTNWVVYAKKAERKFRKLNIAVIQQSPDLGGAETFMLSLINKFSSKGHKVSLYTNKGKFLDEARKKEIVSYELPVILDVIGNYKGLLKSIFRLPKGIIFYTKLLKKLRKDRVDVILMSGFSEKMLVSLLSIFFKIPVLWIEYGPLSSIFKKNFYIPKILYRLLKFIPFKIIVPTKNTRQDLINNGRISLAKFSLIPCGTDFSQSNKPKSSTNSKKIIIGNISRLTREKGHEFIIDAASQIVKKHKNVEFLMVGDGPDRKYYEEKVKDLKLDKYFNFAGFVKDIDSYLSKMDIFVFPSVWKLEGFGLVAIEAMGKKIPVIGNDFGPIKEVVGNGGVLVDIRDKKSLTDAMEKLLSNDLLRRKVGYKGYLKAKNEYDIDRVANSYEEVLYDAVYIEKQL